MVLQHSSMKNPYFGFADFIIKLGCNAIMSLVPVLYFHLSPYFIFELPFFKKIYIPVIL